MSTRESRDGAVGDFGSKAGDHLAIRRSGERAFDHRQIAGSKTAQVGCGWQVVGTGEVVLRDFFLNFLPGGLICSLV